MLPNVRDVVAVPRMQAPAREQDADAEAHEVVRAHQSDLQVRGTRRPPNAFQMNPMKRPSLVLSRQSMAPSLRRR